MRLLEAHPEYSQRQLSQDLGVSLGRAHDLLRALLDKGLVKAQNFQRSERKLGHLYVLPPAGGRRKAQLMKSFLVRKEHEDKLLRREIAELRAQLEG